MTSISPTNRREYRLLERRFWQTLRQTFSKVFVTGTEPVDLYQVSLSNSSPYERLLALHDDPLDVAAVLLSVTLTPEIISRYEAMVSESYPAQGINNPPRKVSVAVERPVAAERPIPDWGSELPRPRERKGRRTTALVSMLTFERLMDRLGYAQARQGEKVLIWKLRQGRASSRGLAQVVATLAPRYKTSHNQPAYDVRSVLDVYDHIIALAAHNRAPPETLRMVREQQDQFAREFG
jgi:hypothetical protein